MTDEHLTALPASLSAASTRDPAQHDHCSPFAPSYGYDHVESIPRDHFVGPLTLAPSEVESVTYDNLYRCGSFNRPPAEPVLLRDTHLPLSRRSNEDFQTTFSPPVPFNTPSSTAAHPGISSNIHSPANSIHTDNVKLHPYQPSPIPNCSTFEEQLSAQNRCELGHLPGPTNSVYPHRGKEDLLVTFNRDGQWIGVPTAAPHLLPPTPPTSIQPKLISRDIMARRGAKPLRSKRKQRQAPYDRVRQASNSHSSTSNNRSGSTPSSNDSGRQTLCPNTCRTQHENAQRMPPGIIGTMELRLPTGEVMSSRVHLENMFQYLNLRKSQGEDYAPMQRWFEWLVDELDAARSKIAEKDKELAELRSAKEELLDVISTTTRSTNHSEDDSNAHTLEWDE